MDEQELARAMMQMLNDVARGDISAEVHGEQSPPVLHVYVGDRMFRMEIEEID